MNVQRGVIGLEILVASLLGCAGVACAAGSVRRLPEVDPSEVGMSATRLEGIEPAVREGLREGHMPGCVVVVGRRGKIAYRRAFGCRQIEPVRVAMTVDTVFDLASLTKPLATATSVMLLVEQGKLRLHDRVAKYLPEFGSRGKERITVLQLLTHQSGLTPDNCAE